MCRSLKRLRRQLDNVKGLQQEIDEQTALQAGQLARRKVCAHLPHLPLLSAL
jgi:hypothetical protein